MREQKNKSLSFFLFVLLEKKMDRWFFVVIFLLLLVGGGKGDEISGLTAFYDALNGEHWANNANENWVCPCGPLSLSVSVFVI